MELQRNMEFEIKNSFIPNFSQSESLRILEVTNSSVVIQMDKSGSRGVFPLDHFSFIEERVVIAADSLQYAVASRLQFCRYLEMISCRPGFRRERPLYFLFCK